MCDKSNVAFKSGYKTISDIGKERLCRIIKNIDKEIKQQKSKYNTTLSFKVYKLRGSSFKPWENYHGEDVDVIENLFSSQVTPLVENWKEEDLFTEVLLLEGFPLDSVVTPCSQYKKNTVKEVSSTFCEHKLFVCLDKKIDQSTIKGLTLGNGDIFICLDSAVNDQTKASLDDKGLIKTI